jgi:hypothetical protein
MSTSVDTDTSAKTKAKAKSKAKTKALQNPIHHSYGSVINNAYEALVDLFPDCRVTLILIRTDPELFTRHMVYESSVEPSEVTELIKHVTVTRAD